MHTEQRKAFVAAYKALCRCYKLTFQTRGDLSGIYRLDVNEANLEHFVNDMTSFTPWDATEETPR